MIKDKKSLKVKKSPSRRKFFKAAAATGVAAVAAAAPVAAAALKNLRLEGVLVAFNDFLSLIIISPLLVN